MGELSGCQLGHYRLVPILAWDREEVRGKAFGVGFGWYFANSAKFYEVFWNGSELPQVPETFILVSRIWIMAWRDGVKSFDIAEFWRSHLKLAVLNSSVGCLGLFQSFPTRYAFNCGLMFASSSWENIPGHSKLFIMCFQHVFVNNSTTEGRPEMFFHTTEY